MSSGKQNVTLRAMKAYLRLVGVNPEWLSKPGYESLSYDKGRYIWGWDYMYAPPSLQVQLGDNSAVYNIGHETLAINDITRSIYEFVVCTGNLPTH